MNKFIAFLLIQIFFQQVFSQDTLVSPDIIYKSDGKSKLAHNKITGKVFTGYLIEKDNGNIRLLCKYVEGKLFECKEFYGISKLLRITHYQENGIEDGEFKEWDKNAKIKIEGKFLKGDRNGVWRYYNDGKLSSIGAYEFNQKVGIWQYFDKQNGLIKKEFYINGVLQ